MIRYFQLLRVHHWLKNGFVFAPAFFGGALIVKESLLSLLLVFVAFSLVASAVYVLNDICDLENDKQHPVKSKRPLASGEVPLSMAYTMIGVLVLASGAIAVCVSTEVAAVIGIYFVINIFYSLGLKKISLLDILLVSSGFILRIVSGSIASGVEISQWLYLMTFLLSLFLAIAKRRDDVILLEQTGKEMRGSIKGYTLEFVNVVMGVMSAVIIVSYILYITSPEITKRFEGKPLYVSTVFVIIGLMRYLQLTIVEKKSGSPTKILITDIFIQVIVAMWIAYFAWMIYSAS